MNRSTLFRFEMSIIAILLLLAQINCGGGGGDGDTPLLTEAEVTQLAADNGITPEADKGTVVVDTSQVTTASIHSSALVGELTVTLYDPEGGVLEAEFALSNGLVVFFNIAPGTVTVEVTRAGEVLYSESHAVAAGALAEVRARPKAAEGGGDGADGQWVGDWIQVNFLGDDDNGVWDTDSSDGIGFTAVITPTSWTETDESGCSVTYSYSVDSDLHYARHAQSATPQCGWPDELLSLLDETGRLVFHEDKMDDYFDPDPGDTLLAFRWRRQ